jgi:RNA 3'-terminal phosphate cyclase (ATP)
VGTHLADQLLLPMALAGAGSFTVGELTEHTRSNAEVISKFLPVKVLIDESGPLAKVSIAA